MQKMLSAEIALVVIALVVFIFMIVILCNEVFRCLYNDGCCDCNKKAIKHWVIGARWCAQIFMSGVIAFAFFTSLTIK